MGSVFGPRKRGRPPKPSPSTIESWVAALIKRLDWWSWSECAKDIRMIKGLPLTTRQMDKITQTLGDTIKALTAYQQSFRRPR
jgi:hypothetical protein